MKNDYLSGVLITESKVDPVDGHEFTEGERLRHSRLGVITELGELIDIWKKHIYYGKDISETHLIEEVGDLFWYVGLGFNVYGIIAANPEMDLINAPNAVVVLEKAMFVVTDDSIDFEDRLQFVYRAAVTVVRMQGLDYDAILDKNLTKLRKRYGDSFDADRAINRDTAAEYAAMEQEG